MKNITPSNPLKTFNDNNALAVKKMGGAQAAFKKKLPKAQNGDIIGGPTTPGPVQTAEWKRNKERSKYFTPDNIRIPGTKLPLKISNEIAKEKRDQIVRQGMNMLGYKKGGTTKSLPKAQTGKFVKPATKTWNIGDPTPSGQVVKTQKDIENLNKMERLNSYGRPVDKYTNPPILSKPKTKTVVPNPAVPVVPKASIGGAFNTLLTAKKVYNTYAKAKQKGKVLDRMAHTKKPTKSAITKLMSKSFNAIKNKKK